MVAKIFIFQLDNFGYFLVKNDYSFVTFNHSISRNLVINNKNHLVLIYLSLIKIVYRNVLIAKPFSQFCHFTQFKND